MPETGHVVRLEFPSLFEMIDLVQAVSDQLSRHLGLDEDAQHWVGVAVRESVINAIKHGNKGDPSKIVTVEFTMIPANSPCELTIRVRDRGEGFDPGQLPDPLAPENLLKASGRGIFFMRSFMDDVEIARANGGGMEVRMVKRFTPAPAAGKTPEPAS
jgi:serine/threonine-protein kinase RsbW